MQRQALLLMAEKPMCNDCFASRAADHGLSGSYFEVVTDH